MLHGYTRRAFTVGIVCLWIGSLNASEPKGSSGHPFILWTPEEAQSLRERIEKEPWARQAVETMPVEGARESEGLPGLFRYSILGDRGAGEAEKKALLEGTSGHGRYLLGVRYDVLHDLLTAAERAEVERMFRERIEAGIESMTGRQYNRWNWLPNLAYPWYLDLHLMAAALRDEALARKIFESHNGLKWYLDFYLSDLGFYNEEFGKMYNTPDAVLLWGRACQRLGWDTMGFGYQGAKGATIRGHLESVLRIGMPSVDLGTSRRHYPRMSLGDAKGVRGFPAYGFQHYLVAGWLTDREGGRPQSRWSFGEWSWFELAHAAWPDAGFDYFLAQRRAPGEERYYPSLLFGLDPIDPAETKPPPAPSGVYPGRGIVVLRAEEGPEFWESPAPAVGLRLATPYAHHIQDCFSLTGLYAFQRPLFVNHQHSSNYSGVDPGYSNSPRSHSTVIVDFATPATIGEVPVEHWFHPLVKFVWAEGRGIYPDVTQSRTLALTREYLLDVFHLESHRPRHYQWIVHALGNACPGEPRRWAESHDLVGSLFDLQREQSLETDEAWSVTTVQSSGGAHPRYSGLGERWFQERVGVHTTVLGEEGTTAYTAWAPVVWEASGYWHGRDRFAYGEDEPAGAAIVCVRKKPRTTFTALHEPFRAQRRIAAFESLVETAEGVLLRIVGASPAFTDYVLLPKGQPKSREIPLVSDREAFTFSFFGHVRVAADRVIVSDGVRSLRIPVGDSRPRLLKNDRVMDASCEDGVLRWGKAPVGATVAEPRRAGDMPHGPISARWLSSDVLCIPTGGRATARLRLRNEGLMPVDAIVCWLPTQLGLSPREIRLDRFGPGEEMDVDLTVDARHAARNRIHTLELTTFESPHAEVQPAPLKVAHGVVSERSQLWPADFAETIYAPRYVAKYYFMDSTAAGLLLDPLGRRRFIDSKTSYPNLVRWGSDSRDREGWIESKLPKFPYFITVRLREGEERAYLYEGGRHAHGTTGGLEHWFTEDWIVCRFRDASPGERIALDWHPTARKSQGFGIIGRVEDLAEARAPGKVLLAARDGSVVELSRDSRRRIQWPKSPGEIAALFVRPAGYEYGAATFYPPESRLEKEWITHPGDSPVGFTFCGDDELQELVRQWVAHTPTGVATDAEKAAYGAAFMPHLVEPPLR